MREFDVAARYLHLHLDDLARQQRRAAWKLPAPHAQRGYVKLYTDLMLQANRGADFDFLVSKSGAMLARDDHCTYLNGSS